MKITITTWYEVEYTKGDTRTLKAQTAEMTGLDKVSIQSVLDMHQEKVGAIERKLLK